MGPLAVKRTIGRCCHWIRVLGTMDPDFWNLSPPQSIRRQRTCNSVMVEHNQITAVMEPNLNDQNSSFSLDVMLLAYMQRGRTFRKKGQHRTSAPKEKKATFLFFPFPFFGSCILSLPLPHPFHTFHSWLISSQFPRFRGSI